MGEKSQTKGYWDLIRGLGKEGPLSSKADEIVDDLFDKASNTSNRSYFVSINELKAKDVEIERLNECLRNARHFKGIAEAIAKCKDDDCKRLTQAAERMREGAIILVEEFAMDYEFCVEKIRALEVS